MKFWPFPKKSTPVDLNDLGQLPEGIVLADGVNSELSSAMPQTDIIDPQADNLAQAINQEPFNSTPGGSHEQSLDVIFPEASRPPILSIDPAQLKPSAELNGRRATSDDPDFAEPKGIIPSFLLFRSQNQSIQDAPSDESFADDDDEGTEDLALNGELLSEKKAQKMSRNDTDPLAEKSQAQEKLTKNEKAKRASLFQPPALSQEETEKLPSSIIPENYLNNLNANPMSPYQDSMADNIAHFEQRIILQDTRFLNRSINNLVDNYFSQKEDEEPTSY